FWRTTWGSPEVISSLGHHVVAAEKGVEGLHHVGDLAGLFSDGVLAFPGLDVPLPGVLEGVNPADGSAAVLFLNEGVVVLRGVEGRIEINGLVFEVATEDV